MRLWRSIGWGLLTAGLLSGCSHTPPAPSPSRAEVTAPKSQKASIFDKTRAAQNLSNAQALRQAGDAAQARTYAEAAVNDWPSSVDAWAELQADCLALADKTCQQHADFFHDKVASMSDLAPRVAVLGLQNLIEDYDPAEQADAGKPAKTKSGKDSSQDNRRIDEWTFAMAQRMMAFYDRQDKTAALRDAPVERLMVDTYPPGTIAGTMVGVGVGAFAISKIK
jgi:hypothetical protein